MYLLATLAFLALAALFAWGFDQFFGEELHAGSSWGVLSMSDAELDELFDGETQ